MTLPMLPQDLANHAVAGTVLYWLGSFHSPDLGLGLAIAGALFKDIIWDLFWNKGTFDPLDVLATVVLPILFFLQTLKNQ